MPCGTTDSPFRFGTKSGRFRTGPSLADAFKSLNGDDDPDVQVDAERVESEAPVKVTITIPADDVYTVKRALGQALLGKFRGTAKSVIRKLRSAIRSAS